MTSRLLVDRRPTSAIHVLDVDWRPAFRVAAYPGYKANRRPDPPELPPQFDVLREMLDAAGMAVAGADGMEADDAIGALAERASPEEPVDVVTGDRDLLQLVRDPAVRVLFTVRGVSDMHVFDEAAVIARYGVPAALYAEFAILRGDPSDGLPGLPGVGEKTAARLVAEHGGLDGLLAATDLGPRLAGIVDGARTYLEAMRLVVPVRCDVEVRMSPAAAPDRARLDALAERHGLRGPVRRLLAALAPPG